METLKSCRNTVYADIITVAITIKKILNYILTQKQEIIVMHEQSVEEKYVAIRNKSFIIIIIF